MKLTTGQVYNIDTIEFRGWVDSTGESVDPQGYSCWAYFSDTGKYLGPDDHGIEPVFDIPVRHAPFVAALTAATMKTTIVVNNPGPAGNPGKEEQP